MHKRRPDSDRKRPLTHVQMNAQNWRYRKSSPPVDEFADKNGPVITRTPKPEQAAAGSSLLPHPFKCSKCAYVATGRPDFNNHWSLEH